MSGLASLGGLKIPIRSRRRRRRLAALAVFSLVAGSVTAIVVIVGNTGKHFDDKYTGAPPQVYKGPVPHRLSAADVKEVRRISKIFIGSAVGRQHLDDSYSLVTPNAREGLTRAQWRTGAIPVVPYNVGSIIHWSLAWSYADDVAYDVVLAGQPGTMPRGKSFMIELKRPPSAHGRWLVDSWSPVGISTDTPQEAAIARTPPPPAEPPLSAVWLLVPGAILGLLLSVPLAIFGRNWLTSRRARRALSH